ncbi:hypothetical protein, partial [Bacillus cereus]|uniref:hypothetical protein n=1 Tax=Bacillus cereus TaxID=1396 RepID=UPI001E36B5FF
QNSAKAKKLGGDEQNPHSLKFHFTILISSDKQQYYLSLYGCYHLVKLWHLTVCILGYLVYFFICVAEQEEVRKYRIMYI